MIKAIITDIEGTTSSLSFVKDILFPYARVHLADFVRLHVDDSMVQAVLQETCQLIGKPFHIDIAIQQLLQWIDEDAKITPLKTLQGLIWQHGYQQGDFQGHIYSDVVEKLKQWHDQGVALYVYSSGSVQAQKLLFAHTEFGDLTPLFTDYFDTRIGGKKEVASYQRIAEHIGLAGSDILFLSDITEELNAAQLAGFNTLQLVRDATNLHSSHKQVCSFAEINI